MIKVILRNNIFEHTNREFEYEYVPNQTLFDYLAQGQNTELDELFHILNTKYQNLMKIGAIKFLLNMEVIDPPDQIKNITPEDGDTLTILLVPKDFVSVLVTVIIGIVLSAISMGISYLLMPKPQPPTTSNESNDIFSLS